MINKKKAASSKKSRTPSKKTSQVSGASRLDSFFQSMEGYLSNKKNWVAASIVLVSCLLNFICFQQAKDSPAVSMQKWENSDMSFYDVTARHIASGDWLCDTILHPYHDWHNTYATLYFQMYPGTAEPFYAAHRGTTGGIDTLAARKEFINHIFQDKVYHQEPLYVYLMAITYKIFGPHPTAVFGWQLLLSALTNMLVFMIGRQYFGSLVGLIGAIIVMISGPILVYEITLLRTTLTIFLSLLMLYQYQKMLAEDSTKSQVLFGAISGISMLAQSYLVLFVLPALAGYVWKHHHTPKKALVKGSVILAVLVFVQLPLFIRNIEVGAPMFSMAGNGAITYILFNSSHALPNEPSFLDLPYTVKLMHDSGGKLFSAAVACLNSFDSIGSLIHMYKLKTDGLFDWFEVPNNISYYMYRGFSPVLKALPALYEWIAPLGICGFLFGCWRLRRKLIPFVLMLVVSASPMFIGSGLARYRVPFVILITLLAIWFLIDFIKSMATPKWKELVIQISLLAIAFYYTSHIRDRNFFPLYATDIIPCYTFHFEDKLLEMEKEKNDEAYAAATTRLMGILPDYFFKVKATHRIAYGNEAESCSRVANLIRMHAMILKETGHAAEGAMFESQANTLSAIADDYYRRTGK